MIARSTNPLAGTAPVSWTQNKTKRNGRFAPLLAPEAIGVSEADTSAHDCTMSAYRGNASAPAQDEVCVCSVISVMATVRDRVGSPPPPPRSVLTPTSPSPPRSFTNKSRLRVCKLHPVGVTGATASVGQVLPFRLALWPNVCGKNEHIKKKYPPKIVNEKNDICFQSVR